METVTANNNCKTNREAIYLSLCTYGKQIKMELDTGAGVYIVSEHDNQKHFSQITLKDNDLKLKSYSGEEIQINGLINCDVKSAGIHVYTSRLNFERATLQRLSACHLCVDPSISV